MRTCLFCWIAIILVLQADKSSGQQIPAALALPSAPAAIPALAPAPASAPAPKQPICPGPQGGWMYFPNSRACLYFSDEKATWINAVTWCKMMGSHLVEMTGPLQMEVLMAIKMFGPTQPLFKKPGKRWIGLSDLELEGRFKWMTSQKPSTFMSTRDPFKNCVCLEENGNWKAEACVSQMQFICQK